MRKLKIFRAFIAVVLYLFVLQISYKTQEIQSPLPPTSCPVTISGDTSCVDEKLKLDWLAIELSNDLNSKGHIVYYGGRRGKQNEALARATRMKAHVVQNRGVESERVILIDGGFRKKLWFEFYIAPFGATPPKPRPTIDDKDVLFDGVAEIIDEPCNDKKVVDFEDGVTTNCSDEFDVCKIDYLLEDVRDDKARLDYFSLVLMNNPKKSGYIIIYASKRSKSKFVETLTSRMKLYLTNNKSIAANRFQIINGGSRERKFYEMWIVTEGKEPPNLQYRKNPETISQTRAEKISDYDIRSYEDDIAQLDGFAIELQNNETAKGYVIIYGGKQGRKNEAKQRLVCMKNYLVDNRGVQESRLVMIDGGYRDKLHVEMWRIPQDAEPPKPTPTVSPKEVKFKGVIKVKNRCDSGI